MLSVTIAFFFFSVFITLLPTCYTSLSISSTGGKINRRGIMKGQDMSFIEVINTFLIKLPFFLGTKNCLRSGEEGEIGNICDFIP